MALNKENISVRPKWLFAFLMILLIFSGCSSENPTPILEPVPTENTSWVLRSGISGTGSVIRNRTADLSFSVSGQISECFVKTGDRVKEGDLVARLDPSMYLFQVSKAEATLIENQNNYDKLIAGTHKSLIAEAEAQIEAMKSLDLFTATVSSFDVAALEARLDYLTDQPLPEDVSIAQAQVELAQINLDIASQQLAWTELRAPFDGVVTERYTNCYENISIGQSVIQVSDPADISVELALNEFDVVSLSVGDQALITFPAVPDSEMKGEIISILHDESISDVNRFRVLVSMDDFPGWVNYGMTADVLFPSE